MTIFTDAFSRRGLSLYLTFDAPSYRSCMMILRECVRRHGRLPQIVVIDGGPEFQSTYFETLLARYEFIKKTRPPAQARFGSVCERLFGTTNTQFIHNLCGNTQITRNVRQVTKLWSTLPWARAHERPLLWVLNRAACGLTGGSRTTKSSLEEAFDFFLSSTYPDESYAPDGCDRALIFSIGSDDWSSAIKRYVTARTVGAGGFQVK